jgi:hypothetical protein
LPSPQHGALRQQAIVNHIDPSTISISKHINRQRIGHQNTWPKQVMCSM